MLNIFETAILALALGLSLLQVGMDASGQKTKSLLAENVLSAGSKFLAAIIISGLGIWAGHSIKVFLVQSNILISSAILLGFGIKMLFDSIRPATTENNTNGSDKKVIIAAMLSESPAFLATGVAVGLAGFQPFKAWLVMAIILAVLLTAGLCIRNSQWLRSSRVPAAGALLIIAVAAKLIFDLARFHF